MDGWYKETLTTNTVVSRPLTTLVSFNHNNNLSLTLNKYFLFPKTYQTLSREVTDEKMLISEVFF